MSNLLKSKFLLGVMVVAALAVTVTVSAPSKAAADCTITTTLRVGSTGSEVVCLQGKVGANADGHFGPMTKTSVMAFQSSHGLSADGVVGPNTRAVLNGVMAAGSYPVGCTSNSGYSSATGLPCTSGASLPAGCSSTTGYSPTTGLSCSGASSSMSYPAGCTSASGYSPTTGQACSSSVVVTSTGTNGYLVDLALDSTNRVSTVYESETDKVVAGFRATARLADQTVDRVRVTFDNTNSSASSANLSRYISSASLWYGSNKISTIPVAQADRNTSTDVYTFNFTNLNAKVLKDQIGRFYVTVSANGSVDTNDTDATWRVIFLAGGVSATSPDGTYDTYPSGNLTTSGLGFAKFSSNGVKATVGLSTSNPTASLVTVSATAQTNDVTLLKFTVKATNSDLTLRKVPITMLSGSAAVSDIINTLKLYQGSNLVDSVDGSTVYDFDTDGNATTFINVDDTTLGNTAKAGYVFSNLSSPYNLIPAGSTVEFTVVADLKKADGVNYSPGDSLTASFKNADVLKSVAFSVQDVNGDQLTDASATYRVGSAVGEIQTLRVQGVQLTRGTASVATTLRGGTAAGASDIVNVVYSIPVTMTAFGQTLYVPKTAQYAATTADGYALAYGFVDAADPATVISSGAPATDVSAAATGPTLSSTDAATEGSAWRLDAGVAKHFILTVTLNSGLSEAQIGQKSYAVVLSVLQTYTSSTVTGTGTEQSLLPIGDYQTGYQAINYGS